MPAAINPEFRAGDVAPIIWRQIEKQESDILGSPGVPNGTVRRGRRHRR